MNWYTKKVDEHMTFKIKPITNEAGCQRALKQIEKLWNRADRESRETMEVLTTLVDAYEQKAHAILPPDPLEAIRFRMEQNGLSQSDIAHLFGGKNRISEILAGKRRLTVEMIRNIVNELQIPAESLIG